MWCPQKVDYIYIYVTSRVVSHLMYMIQMSIKPSIVPQLATVCTHVRRLFVEFRNHVTSRF